MAATDRQRPQQEQQHQKAQLTSILSLLLTFKQQRCSLYCRFLLALLRRFHRTFLTQLQQQLQQRRQQLHPPGEHELQSQRRHHYYFFKLQQQQLVGTSKTGSLPAVHPSSDGSCTTNSRDRDFQEFRIPEQSPPTAGESPGAVQRWHAPKRLHEEDELVAPR